MGRWNKSHSALALAAVSVFALSVLAFGSVETWSSAFIEISVFTLFTMGIMIKTAKLDESGSAPFFRSRHEKYLCASIVAVLAYVLLQLVPLPGIVLKYVSPRAFELYSFFSVEGEQYMRISLDAYRTENELLRLITCAAFFMLFAFIEYESKTLERVMKILAYFGFAVAVFALVQKGAWNGKIYWFREIGPATPFGPFVNRNHFAGLMGILIPMTLGVAFTRKRRERQILFGFFALIMAVSLFVSLSRAGIISFFSGLAVLSFFFFWIRMRSRKNWAIAVFLCILFLYLAYVGVDPIIDRFYKTDLANEARFAVWGRTIEIFTAFPLTGTGLGSYMTTFSMHSPDPGGMLYDHAHNDYLEFLMEGGVAGVCLLLLFFIFFALRISKGVWSGNRGIIRVALLSSLATIGVHSVFDFNLHIFSNGLLTAAFLGMSIALARAEEEPLSG